MPSFFIKSTFFLFLITPLFSCASAIKSQSQNQLHYQPQSQSQIQPQNQTCTYNEDWWKPVPDSEVKPWEIPPQAVKREDRAVILSKRTELGVFSNLSPHGFELDGIQYASIEGLWQGMKYPESTNDERIQNPEVKWPFTREQIYQMSGFESKKAGDLANANMKKLGINWVTYQGEKIEYKGAGRDRHYEIIFAATERKIQSNPEIKRLLDCTRGLTLRLDHTQEPDVPAAYRTDLILMRIRDGLGK